MIDAHVHVFDRANAATPRAIDGLAPAERTAHGEQLLREMDAAGVERAVLIQMGGVEIEHHRYLASCLRRWPDRFAGAGLVDLGAPGATDRLPALVKATGIRGVRIMGTLGDRATARAEELGAWSLFERAADLGLNVNLYCAADQVPHIAKLADAFPQVAISLDHLGICPSTAMAVDRWQRPHFGDEPIPPANYSRIVDLAQYPNVHCKISGEYAFSKRPYPFADMRPMVERIYAAYGAERMMWATDFPWIVEEPGYLRLVELIDRHLPALTPQERAQIVGGTAARLWF